MFVSKRLRSAFITCILLALPLCVNAYNPFAAINDYNAVIFGNANAIGGDTEGRLAVGGNFTAQCYSVGTSANPDATKYSLVVGGDLNAPGLWQVFNGNTAYGGTLIATPSTVSPYTITQQSGILDFAAIKSQMLSTSSYLTGLTANGSVVYDGYNTITLTGTDSNLNVFTLTEEQADIWSRVTSHQIVAPAGSTVIINIGGTSCTLSNGLSLSGVSNTTVLYNYYEATNLNLSSMELLGSLIAPNAALSLTSAGISGIAVVNESTQSWGGEYHNRGGFTGNVPTVPEPSSVVLALAGLGTMIPLLRIKRK